MEYVSPTMHQHFQHIVQLRRITSPRLNDWQQALHLAPPVWREEGAFACLHPMLVPLDRIYLPIVCQLAHRLCQRPRRKSIRAVTLVKNGKSAAETGVSQVEVETR